MSSAPKEVLNFDIQSFIKEQAVPVTIKNRLKLIDDSLNSTTELSQKIKLLHTAADLWKDSLKKFEGYAFYSGEAAKLDNSEKNLTFAAQLFLSGLRTEEDAAKLNWESSEAIQLFEKAIALNPENDDLKIDLASCYIYGKGRNGDPQQTMKGILSLLDVVRRDSSNMKAQLVLGVGGYVSGQYDKAIGRLTKVILNEPGNIEAMAFLADTYAAKGDKPNAIKCYNILKKMVNDPDYTKEIDERIGSLNKR